MSNKPTKVLFKRNSTANTPPTPDKLVPGEIALNTADGKIFTKTDAGVVIDTGKQIFERNTNVTVNDDGTNPGYVVTSVDGQTKFTVDPTSATLDADLVMVGGKVISLHELVGNGTNKVNIAAPDNIPLDYTLKLPQVQGTNGQVMAIGENGQMEFVAPDRFGGNRVYVSADRGDDANDGVNAPVKSVKRAAQIASELIFEHTGTPATGASKTRVLLFKNKEFIKAEVAAWIDYNYVDFDSHYDSATCERDIGLIVDAVSYDLITGSNFASSVAGMAYYRIQSGLVTSKQLIQTIEAITYAKTRALTYVQSAQTTATTDAFDNVISILNGDGLPAFTFADNFYTDADGSTSAATLQANRTTYQTGVETYLDLNYHTLWHSLSAGQQLTCKRDVGYIIDAVTYDILYGGNYQSVIAGNAYYSFGTLEIAAGEKAATLAAYNYLKFTLQADVEPSYGTIVGDLVDDITDIIDTNVAPTVIYPTLPGSGSLLTSYNALQTNKSTIQSDVTTHITNTFSSFTYGTLGTTAGAVKSARDAGLVLDGAIFDMYFGGNEKSREYGLSFYNGTATYLLANEKTICVQALTYAKSIAQKIVTNTEVVSPYQTVIHQVRDSVNYGTNSNATAIGAKYDIAIGILANGAGTAPTLDPGAYRIRGVSIRIAPGNYFENNPIIVPDACSIIGDDLRSAVVRPLNANKDIFRVRNGVYMNGFTFRDHVNTAGVADYTWRYTHAFDDVSDIEVNRSDWTWIGNDLPVIQQSPYIQNCSIISFLGGSGCLIDGSKVRSPNIPKFQNEAENPAVGDTPEQGKSMVGNAYTMLSFGGTGWQVINNAYSQIVGCFQIFLLNGIYAQSGGYISVTNSATNFGTFALRASGYSDKSFTFDRGIIAANGVIGGAQTLTIIGTQRVPLVQYVARFFNPSNGTDITSSYKSSPTVVPFNAATALTLGSSVFTINAHGFFTGNSVYYSRNGNTQINGLSDNAIYYVQVANVNQFILYNDDSFKYPVTINAPGTGTQQLIKNPEEFYVNDISTSHTTYQRITLAGSSFTFVPGRAISATVDIYQANAYVYSWDSGSRELIISNEFTTVNGSDERVLFTSTSTINQDHALTPATAIVISAVAVKTGLTTAVVFPKSTIEGGTISSIGGLPEKNISFHRPSIVNSSAHTWEYAGSGTDYNALPQNGGVPNPNYEQYSEAPGRVYVSGTNELGDFKVGNFITAENRSGLITFKSKVTVGELNVLKLTLSSVQINQISADVGLGDNEPGGASNQRLPTQKAVRSFLANRLGSVIDKGVSTNSVPGSLVQLNASGQINSDLLPPQKAAITYQVGTWNGRLSLYNKIPPVDIGISDQANEKYYQQTLTLSNTLSATVGQVVTQINRTGTGIVKFVVTSSNQVTIANVTGTFSTNSIDHIFFDGVDSGYYPTNAGTAVEQSETYYLALDNKSQFLLVDSGEHEFTVGNTVQAVSNLATGQVTEYRKGVLYTVNNTGLNGGAGYQPGSGSVIYNNVPLTNVTGSGSGALADITVTGGSVTNVAVNFGGSGYAVGNVLSANSASIGGTSTVTFEITVNRADNRLYVDLNGNNIKFLATSLVPDYLEDDNASTNDHTFTAYGNAQLSTVQKKFGSASLLLDGTGDYIATGSSTDFQFSTGAFTVEMWVYRTGGSGAIQVLADFRASNPQVVPVLYLSATDYYASLTVNGATVITGTQAVPLNTWTHVIVSRTGTDTKIFVGGVQSGSTYTDTNNYIAGPLTIGARFDGTTAFYGYLDDVRVSKGVARSSTPPTSQLTRLDVDTVLLLNFNGPNGTTNINYSEFVKTITDLTYYSSKTFNAVSTGGGGNVDYSLSRITITSHGFTSGDPVYYNSGVNAAIGNLVSNSSYFAKAIDANNIELYSNYNLSTKIAFGLTSTGTHSVSRYNVNTENFFFVVPSHGYTTGTPVRVTGSTPPGGIVDNEYFFIGSITTNAFTLHATRANALTSVTGTSTAPIDINSTGAGTLTFITQNVQINGTLNTSSKTAGNWNNLTSTTIDASGIVSGVINPSRLGSTGTANNQTFLRGDSSWAYATASAKPAADSPVTISGDFDIRAGTNYYHGDLTFDINKVDPTLGATYTNFGVAAFNKSQFTLTSTGQVSITQGVVDAATLGGFSGSYYLTPSNFIAQVPITKGGTNLTTYSKGDILFAPSTNSLAQLNIGSTGQILNVDATGIPAWSDNANLPGYLNVQSTTQSNLTTNGSITTAGGVGIAKNLNVGQAANITGDITGTGALTVNSADKNISLQPTGTGTVTINPATKGAINNVDIGATTTGSAKFTTLEASGNTKVTSNTTSTTTGTGALVVSGGVGIGENLNVYGDTKIGGNLTVNGTTTTVNSTVTTIQDPILDIGGGVGGVAPATDDNKDRGIKFQWHTGAVAKTGFFGFKDADGYFEFIPDATITGEVATGSLGDIKAGTFRGNLTSSSVTITGGTINNTSIGATNTSTGAFTTLTASDSVTFTKNTDSTDTVTGTLIVTGGVGVSGKINSGSIGTGALTATSNVNLDGSNATVSLQPTGTGTVTIKPNTTGAMNNMVIGATGAKAGTFTDLTANTSVSMSPSGTVTINPTTAGTIDNMAIGGTTKAAGGFTSLTANGAVTLTQNTASTNTTSGTLVVTGGVGVSGAVNIGSTISAGGATFTNVTDSGLTSGRVTFASTAGLLSDSSSLTFDSGSNTLTVTNLSVTGTATVNATVSSLTSGRVVYSSTGGSLIDNANLAFNGTKLTANALDVTNNTLVGGTLSVTGVASVTNTTESSSTTNGALVVSGGIGVAKNVNVGGNLAVTGTTTLTDTLTTNGQVDVNPANKNVSIQPTGSGVVTINSGTAGTINNMSIGVTTAAAGRFTTLTATTSATLSPSGTVTINPTTTSSVDNVNIGANTAGSGAFTTLDANSTVTFSSTTDSSSSTTGAVKIAGGVGIAKKLYVGTNLSVTGTTTLTDTLTANGTVDLNPANYSVSIQPTGTGSATINPTTTGSINNMAIGATNAKAGTFTTLTATSNVTANTTNSNVSLGSNTGSGVTAINSGSTGSINNMSIGVTTSSIGKFTTLQATTSADFSPSGTVTINPTTKSNIDNVDIGTSTAGSGKFTTISGSGQLNVTNATESTDTLTGSIITAGGLGVAKNANVGGNLVITGNLTVNGTTTTVNSTVSTVEDPIMDIGGGIGGAAPTTNDGKDRGITFQYYKTDGGGSAKRGFFGFDHSTGYFKYIKEATVTNDVATGSLADIQAGTFRGDVVGGTGSFTTLSSNDTTTFTKDTDSTTLTSGALQVTGGTAIGKKLNVGGTATFGLNSFNRVSITGSQTGSPVIINAIGDDTSININLVPQGDQGIVNVNAITGLKIPVGASTDRPTNPVNGLIRFNTTATQFEGYNGVGWSSLGGVRDVAGKTYIIPELTAGSRDKTLYFYAENSGGTAFQAGTWTSELLQINSPGFRVPTGNQSQRPTGLYGEVRFNTDSLQFEGYDGTSWASLGGTRSQDGNTYIGATNGTLSFYAGNVLQGTVTTDGFNLGNIRITGNTVSATNTNGNVNLSANGSGVVKVTGTGAFQIPAGTTLQQPSGNPGYMRYNTDTRSLEVWDNILNVYKSVGGGGVVDNAGVTKVTVLDGSNNDTNVITFSVGNGIPGAPAQTSLPLVTISQANGLLVEGSISIHDNVIENITADQDLIIRANGTGRVIIDGSGSGASAGNLFATDPLLTLNSGVSGTNTYDSGFIINRGTTTGLNKGFVYSEVAGEFRLFSTIEQGTVKGNITVSGYENLAVASIKLNSETANKITFTDASKVVRSLDAGRTAEVDGTIIFNSASQIALPVGTQAQRPVTPVDGSVRFNTDTQLWEGYAQGGWGQLGVGTGSAVDFQGFTADGSTHNFTMNQTPLGAASIIVAVNGVVQQPGTAYNVSGNILQFQDAYGVLLTPDAGDLIDVRYLSKPAVGTIRTANYVADGSTTHFASSIPITTANEILVFVNNVWQDAAVYTVSGYDVIFTEAPLAGDRVNLLHIAVVVAPNLLTSAFHGFTRDANGNLLYTKLTTEEVMLRDSDGNELYTEKLIGTSDGNYSINSNGQLIYTYDGY
jgi:hypothetical protein